MPINNDVYGVWKLLKWKDNLLLGTADPQYYVVENARIGTQQKIQNQPFVQGTALPLILNVSGAVGTLQITAPLLVTESPRALLRGGDSVSDGYRMWVDVMYGVGGVGGGGAAAGSLLKSNYVTETGVIFEELGFSVDSRQGCRYTINLRADSNYLVQESGYTAGSGIEVVNGSEYGAANGVFESPAVGGWWGPFKPTTDPFTLRTVVTPCRVATFYDVVGYISSTSTTFSGYLEKLDIRYRFNTQGFNYVGQKTQREIMGAGGIEARVTGTMISGVRSPLGYEFPYQSMNSDTDVDPTATYQKIPPTKAQYGGTVKHTDISFSVWLRNGTTNVIVPASDISLVPGLNITQSLFESSTQQISADLLRTEFNAFGWVTDPNPFG